MHIGFSLTTLEPAISQGKIDGIGMYTKNLYEALLRRNEKITPFSFPNTKGKMTSAFPNGRLLNYSYMLSTIGSLLSPLSLHGNLKQDIDLFHATDHMIPRIKDIPLVATIHDAIMFQHPEWHSFRFGKLKKMIRKKTFRWPDRYITISKAMVAEIVEFGGIDPDKIDVIYHGVAPEWFVEASDETKYQLRKKYHLPEKFILFASTLQEKKNLPRLVQAYLQLSKELQDEYPLIIVGRTGWGNKESMAAVEKITSQKKGAWLNYVSYDDLRTLFQCATLYVHPSLHEGFGLTILEAFASKTPVITSNVAAMPEVAGDAALLIDPLSVDDIKQAMTTLLLNEHLSRELTQKGIMRAKEFSWNKCAEETIKVYNLLL
jgi:glycosyltransferase involved in cell wall biosynthesis